MSLALFLWYLTHDQVSSQSKIENFWSHPTCFFLDIISAIMKLCSTVNSSWPILIYWFIMHYLRLIEFNSTTIFHSKKVVFLFFSFYIITVVLLMNLFKTHNIFLIVLIFPAMNNFSTWYELMLIIWGFSFPSVLSWGHLQMHAFGTCFRKIVETSRVFKANLKFYIPFFHFLSFSLHKNQIWHGPNFMRRIDPFWVLLGKFHSPDLYIIFTEYVFNLIVLFILIMFHNSCLPLGTFVIFSHFSFHGNPLLQHCGMIWLLVFE